MALRTRRRGALGLRVAAQLITDAPRRGGRDESAPTIREACSYRNRIGDARLPHGAHADVLSDLQERLDRRVQRLVKRDAMLLLWTRPRPPGGLISAGMCRLQFRKVDRVGRLIRGNQAVSLIALLVGVILAAVRSSTAFSERLLV